MKRLVGIGMLLAVVLVQPVSALAAWILVQTGTGSSTSTGVLKLAAPNVVRSGSNADVFWSQGTLGNGVAVERYTVTRTVGATTTAICTVAEPTRTCTDSAPVEGVARYAVFATYRNWVGPSSNTTAFTFDTIAPVTTVTSSPAPNANGWVTSAPTLMLTATDASSTIASITYTVGASAPVTVNAASTSFSVAATGSTTVTYRATDSAGNVEATKTYVVKRDSVAPSTALSSNPTPNSNGWVTSTPTLTLSATDATSGVSSITYTVGAAAPVTVNGGSTSFAVPAAGSTTVTYFATDVAGNVEATKTYTVKRDSSAPSAVTIKDPVQGGSYATNNSGSGSWEKTCGGRGGICATGTDAESGISTMTYRLIKNGNTCWNGSAFVSGTSCTVTMTFDAANNDWIGGPTRQQMGVSTNWALTVTATNPAGFSTSSTTITFRTT